MTSSPASSGPAAGRYERSGTGTGEEMRRVLVLDAAGTAVVGIGYLAAARPLSRLFGPDTALVVLVGVVMLALGAGIAAVARLRRIPAAAVRAVIGCGALWILLSLAALAFGWLDLTTAGVVWTWLQIVPVAVFVSWQTVVFLRRGPDDGSS